MESSEAAIVTNGHSAVKNERFQEGDLEEMVAVATRVASRAGEHKAKAFEMVLATLLQRNAPGPTARQPTLPPPPGSSNPAPLVARPPGATTPGFLAANGLTLDAVAGVMDVEGGHIIARNLGKSKADQQRRIAALVALRHAILEGTGTVPQAELVTLCKEFSCYDSNNFTANMAAAKTQDDRSVFLKTEDGWKLTAPGESFIVDVLRGLMGPTAQT